MKIVAGKQGFEPRFHDPESCVLPLDDFPATERYINRFGDVFQACGTSSAALDELYNSQSEKYQKPPIL